MEGGCSRMDEEVHPRLLDLIPKEGNWGLKKDNDSNIIEGSRSSHGHGSCADELKLELRLGPPGVEDWSPSDAPKTYKTAMPTPNTSQKRSPPAPVVGWPPIRSFRRNIASTSSVKPARPVVVSDSKNNVVKMAENCHQGLFVKINMEGVPIGRKVDLKAYDSYQKLSIAVDQLFRGLLAAQSVDYNQDEEKGEKGLLDGSSEYTLVYEDHEGDRMLVGDVPWLMFVSAVKRLRVFKSSELSKLYLGTKQEKIKD